MSDHERWRKRLLGFEELEGDERRQTASHLFQCASCRALLESLQSVEQEVQEMEGISLESGVMEGLAPEDRLLERESLLKLLRRMDLEPSVPVAPPSPSWADRIRDLFRPALLAPVAGVLLLIVALLGPWRADSPRGIESFELALAHQLRNGASGWSAGDAVVANFRLHEAGFPILIHVDEAGTVSLLHPESAESPLREMPSGATLRLPPENGDEAWVLEGAGERHSFLLVSTPSAEVDLAALMARLQATSGEREAVIEMASTILSETLDAEVERRDLVVAP